MPKSKEIVSSSEEDQEVVKELIEHVDGKLSEVDSAGDQKSKRREDSSDSESDEPVKKKKAKTTAPAAIKGHGVKVNGELRFELGRMKFATVCEFKGRKMVNIREFYMTAEDEMRPGKKGIALLEDQWKKLREYVNEIDSALSDL